MPIDPPAERASSSTLLLRAALWIGLGAIMMVITTLWWFDAEADRIRQRGRHRTAALMAEGLANAVEGELISRNLAQLENRLLQTLADEQVMSAIVMDTQGKVLSWVQRDTDAGPPHPVYQAERMALPLESTFSEVQGDRHIHWLQLRAGVPIGWVRIELTHTETDDALIGLRHRMSLLLAVACLSLLTLLAVVLRRTHALIHRRETQMEQSNDQLTETAYRDSVTQLPNRLLLLDRLDQAIGYCLRADKQLAVCFLDLDGFKQVNDTLGHDAGDQVLRVMGARFQDCVRRNDTVARLGGDEFVLLLTEIEGWQACEEVLQRVLATVREPIVLGQQTVHVTSSIGVALYPQDRSDPGMLLTHADQAMYRAKRAGKDRIECHPS